MPSPTLIQFIKHEDSIGTLCAFERGSHVPFDIRRVFTVSAHVGSIRGNHAHKQCTQMLICVSGEILVSCDNGSAVTQHLLNNMGVGLLVPPRIWAKEEYLDEASVLMVLCDRSYEAGDYIRDYNDFKTFVGL